MKEGQVGRSGMFGLQGSKAHNNESVDKVDIRATENCEILSILRN